ncbi:T9SS type B sorting domain-containing protein [Flavobacterium aquiphilum]|uniref:T9SS type B sorting domain-containing protein n=1 Tax=Flavobacterium aquiphilum TaxID=3003261 RepID=UPI0024803889|nr:T9SS type B sorting domain-containing protein [Flavobacterium aquiphilum]
MKKPTFSSFRRSLLALLNVLFLSDSFRTDSFFKVFQNFKSLSFYKVGISAIQNKLTVGFVFLFFFNSFIIFGQNLKAFTPSRFDTRLKGDMLLIGNNILNRNERRNERPNDAYNGNGYNSDFSMEYINVDSDGGKNFSSSTAKLTIPKPACYKVVYAGLYWGAILQQTDRSNIEKVRLKLPNATSYTDITGTIVYDANATPIGSGNNKPYACYADITSLVKGLSDAQGNYTVANVISSTGSNGTTGLSAGWSIFVVYEDPTLPAKYITTFDGFSGIGGPTTLDIPISGFKTIPTGPVRVKFAFSALEGDQQISGDYLQINGTAVSATNSAGTVIRGTNNFFNSSVTYIDPATGITENFQNRTPASTNTLGYDAGILNIDNPNNGIIANDATSAKITLGSTQDVYFYYFNAFAVDIIEPKIVLTKVVKNDKNQDIGNQNVTLGQILNYEIELQNIGNDNATSLTIRDVLPVNTIFNYPTDPSSVTLPTGITVKSYNSSTREIVFDVNNSIVEVGDGKSKILLKVQVVPSCNMLSDACSNSIDNQAFATYKGTLNTNFTISDDPSINTNTGCLLVPKATNFLVGVDDCKFTKNEVLCGNSVVITAANGYNSYKWSTAPFDNTGNTTGTILGSNQTLTVTNPGTYYVYNTAIAPCLSITEAVTVSRFGGIVTNPVIPFADQWVTCPNDGKQLPNIFLCGLNATRAINTNISDGSTIVWEKLNEASCTAVSNQNCANENSSCTWTQVETGASYTANTSGQFRLTLNYPGGCFNRFYFNVYQNLLDPTETHRDIICNTKGNITIGGVPSGYEYSIDGTNYQASNSFTINTAGLYTVYIRQVGVTSNPCIFKVPNIQIRQRNFTVSTTVTQPLCFGEKGSIKVAANDVEPQYNFKIFNGGTLVNSVGPTTAGDYTFSNLTPGITYQVQVTTQDGCSNDQWIYISQPSSAVTANAAIVEPLTACNDGKIVITTQGGTGPYYYFVNGSSTFQTSNEIIVTTPGKYDILVVDSKNCSGTATVTVPDNSKPTYTIGNTNSTCYGNGSQITIGNIVANGYTMSYSIDNGATFSSNPVFSNLYPGTYNVVVKYTITYMSQWNGQQTKTCQDPAVTVTITGPTSAVSASAGVGELAGCGPLQGGQPTGLLRITNVQGGTAPYQYSYDGGNIWEASSQKYVVAGTYSLAVKDALGCTYQIPYSVILDPKPADPVIQDNVNTIYNCDGTATATVIVNNPASSGGTTYTYQYYLDNVLNTNTPTNTFLNVPSGSHTVKVKYDVSTVSSYSNLLSEDFGRGDDTTSPGINSAYCWEKQDGNTLAFATCSLNDWHPWLMNDGDYVVTKALLPDHFNDFNWWLPKDHTAVLNNTPSITDGRFLAVNIGATIPIGAVLYSKPINDVIPNQSINVSLYMANLLKASNNLPSPQLRVQLVKNGTVIASQAMPDIPRDEKWHFSTDLTGSVLTLNPGDNTSLDFQIISNSQVVTGNDLAIDDIQVYQIPKSCGNEREFPVIIDGSKAFKASLPSFSNPKCNGGNDGTITIAAENFNTTTGYQYNIDGGTFQTTTVSPFVLTGIGVGSHTIVVQNDATGICSYLLKQVITSPTAVTVTASVTTLPTCTTGATITAIGSGGTPGYEFELRASDGTTVITGFQASGIFTNVASGNYKVFVRDANLCTGSGTGVAVSVTAPTAPTATLDTTTDYCYTTADPAKLVVKVTGGLAPYTYTTTFNGGTPSAVSPTFAGPTFTYTATAPGTYAFDVYDANGCKANTISQVINDELTVATPVTTGLDCDAAPSNQAVITGTISGGKAPFVVTLVSGTGGTLVQPVGNGNTFTYSNAVAGTYGFQVKDANNCLATSSQKIDPLVPITLGSTNISPKCNGGSDGSIQLNPSGGSGGFTYSKDGVMYDNTSLFTGLSAGIKYTYYVQDSNKCIKSIDVTLAAPSTISATAAITTPYTCDGPAVISVTSISGGKGPYNYTLNRGATVVSSNTSGVFSGISVVGNYTVAITDANGCPATATPSLTISALNGPTDLTFTYKSFDCDTNTSAFNVNLPSSGGGQPPIRFQIIALPASIAVGSPLYNYLTQDHPDGQYSGVPAGVYTFEVTDKNNCKYQEVYELAPEPPIVVSGSVLNNVKCFGTATGSVEFSVSGFATTYSYTINNGASSGFVSNPTITLTNLAAGDYTISVTDKKTGCVRTAKVSVLAPPTELKIDSIGTTPITCLSNATVTINTVGGWGSNTYTVTGTAPVVAPVTQSTNSFTISAPGNYTATVTDMNGCSVTQNFTIANKVNPVASIDPSSDYCYDSTDKATLIVTPNANPNYVYNINNGTFQSTGTFANLTPGAYVIRVKDITTGCILPLASETIASQVSAGTAITKNLDCTSSPNAIIKVTVANGYPDYSYRVSTDGTFTGVKTPLGAGVTTFNYTTTHGPGAATYSFEITDAKGCVTIITQSINAIVSPTATTNPTNPTCFGNSNGSVLVNASLGLAPYTYESSTDGITFVPMASNLYSNAAAGDYWFRVTDANSCTFTTGKVTLTAPATVSGTASITTPYTCTSPATITVGATVTGGNGVYMYTLNRGGVAVTGAQSSKTFNNISVVGSYTVTISDSNGCSFTTPAMSIVALNPPTDLAFSPSALSCPTNKSNVTITTTPAAGNTPYSYTILPSLPAGAVVTLTGIDNLSPGTYTFEVTDAKGCKYSESYEIIALPNLSVNGVLNNNVKCFGDNNGKVTYTVSGFGNGAPYSYTIDGALPATAGTTPVTGSTFDIVVSNLNASSHTIVVTNPTTNCTASTSVTVSGPSSALGITAPTITPITCSANASIVINTTGGWGSNSYTVTGTNPVVAAVTQSSKTFTNLAAGDYTASVTDLNGCTVSIPFTVAPLVAIVASIDPISDYCYDSTDKATLVVSPNANPNYLYNINNGTFQTTGTFANLTPGNYVIRVKDITTGCILPLASETIANQVSASASITKNLDCTSSPNAIIKVTISNGYPGYSYRVNINGGGYSGSPLSLGGATTFNYTTTTGAAAATYTFEITDSKGCITEVTQNINARVSPTVTTNPTNPTCFGGNNGSVLINASLGLAPYTYESSTDGITFVSMASNLYSNATAGDYYFRVTDAKSCTFTTGKVTLTEPSKITASASATNLTCNTSNVQQAALITVNASNGTPFAAPDLYRYSYNGAPYVSSKTFSINTASTVTIDVKDANGCIIPVVGGVTIDPLTALSLSFSKSNAITCSATTTGLTVTVTGGVAPYKYEITAPAAAITVVTGISSTSHTFNALLPDTYTVKVTDANGCSVTDTYKIDAVKPITVSGSLVANVTCNGGNDGKIRFTIGGDTTGYSVVLKNSLGTIISSGLTTTPSGSGFILDYIGLPTETYTLEVNSPTACTVTASVPVSEPTAVTITGINATKVYCSKTISTITVTASGGTTPLSYAVVKHLVPVVAGDYVSTNVFTKNTTADGLDYDVYVKDKNGCPAPMGTVSVQSDSAPTVLAAGTGCLGTGYTITATPGGTVFGTPTYSLNGGSFVGTNVFNITTAGDYTITIKDGNGCTAPSNLVHVDPKLTLNAILDKDITCTSVAPFTNDAQITLTPGGGKAPFAYEYSLNGGSFTSFLGPVLPAPAPISPLTQDNYIFKITDANGCSVATTGPIKVTAKVDPVILSVTIPLGKEIKCNGDATASISITIDNTKGQGPFVFNVKQYADGTYTSPAVKDFGTQTSGLPAGFYEVTVTDAKGCFDTERIEIKEPNPINVSFTPNNITCVSGSGISKGSIVVNSVTGGTGNYTYQVSNDTGYISPIVTSDGTTAETFTLIDFGNYQLTVIDANGCSWIQQDIKIASPPTYLDLVVTPSTPACGALGSAEVKVQASLAGPLGFFFAIYKPGITYTVGDPAWYPEDAPNSLKTTIPNLIPGVTYTFIVYDDNTKCYYFKTFISTVPSGSSLTSTATAVPITCKGSADGSVNLNIKSTYGVNTNVKYEIFNSATLLTTGIVDNGVVNANSTLTISNFGGKPLYSGLPYGTYYVLITETSGANSGCSITTAPFSITESSIPLSVSASVTKNSNTCVANAGIITAIAKDGTATIANPYLYQIFADAGTPGVIDATDKVTTDPVFSATFTPAMTSNTFFKGQGDYIVYAKDAYGCIQAAFVSLVDDTPPTITPQTPPCFVAGMNIDLDLSTFSASTIGTPTYSINGSFQADSNFRISSPGSYTLAIKDGNGCVASTPYVIRDEITTGLNVMKQLDCTVSPEAIVHGVVAGGFGSGTYSYTVKIGSGAFGASVPIVGSTFDYKAATSDTYTFVITDGTCSVTEKIDVDSKVPTVFTTAVVDVKCKGDATGSISVNVTSGEGPFEYRLDGTDIDGTVTRVYQDSNQFDSLKASTTYIVTVRSKTNLCEYASAPITVGEPLLALAVDAPTVVKLKCGTGNLPQAATVTLNVTAGSGSGSYQYSFNGSAYDSGNVFTVEDNGTTQTIPYKVKDANDCEVSSTVTIDKLDPPVFNLLAFSQTTVTCLAPNSDVRVVSTHGVGTLTYETIAPSPMTVNNGNDPLFIGLIPGDYVFRVTDDNGCVDQVSYRVNDVTKIDLQVTSQTDVICDASATGTATFAVTGFGTGVGTYSCTVNGVAFALVAPNSNMSPTISLTSLVANTYLVRVTDDATGCYSEKTVIISNPSIPLSSTNDVTPLGCTIKGAVAINAKDGWGGYIYTLTTPTGTFITQSNNYFGNLSDTSGVYTTSVTDANGCTVTDTFTLTTPANPTVTVLASDYCYDDSNKATLVVQASLGVAPYLFSIDNGQTFVPSNSLPLPNDTYTFSNLAPGSYDIVVKDAYGCPSMVPVNEVIKPQLFATAVSRKDIDCTGSPNGIIKISATGGYGPYSYKVSTDNGVTFSAISTGFTNPSDTDFSVPVSGVPVSYVFEITDSKGCVFVTTPPVLMTPPTPVDVILADIVTTPVDCNTPQGTDNNGTITVNLRAVNDNPDYTYALSGSAVRGPQSSNVFTGLSAGTYDVVVTSGRGCMATVTGVVIANPTVVTASASAPAFSCAVDPTKTVVTVVGGGGTGPYTFSKDGVNYFTSNSSPTADNKYAFDLVDNASTQNPTYWVKDSNGCVQSTTLAPISPLPKLTSVIATNGLAMDCINNQQAMNVVISGGSNTPNPFTYQVYQDGVAIGGLTTVVANSFTYNAPTAGHYYAFKVFDNNTSCDLTSETYDVPLFNKINVVATPYADVKCKSATNGAIEINVTGYSGTYNYEVYDGGTLVTSGLNVDTATSNPFVIPFGFGAGTAYTVKVIETAFPSCSTTSNVVVITEPALALTISNDVTPLGCTIKGAVAINAKDGWGGYTYTLTTPTGTVITQSNNYFGNLSDTSGVYTTSVTDANGCTVTDTFTLTTPANPTVTVLASDYCYDDSNKATLVVQASSGVAPYLFSIDNGQTFVPSNSLPLPNDTYTFSNLAPGSYDIVVKDAYGCPSMVPVNEVIKPQLFATAVSRKDIDCTGSPNGIIKISATGGYGPYSYKVSTDNGVTFSAISTGFTNPSDTDFSVPVSGVPVSYVFEITDSKGCVFVTTPPVLMTPPTPVDVILADIVTTPVDCNTPQGTDNNGTITVNLRAVNDNPDYTYALSGSAVRGPQSSNVFTGLSAGTYDVVVTSGRGCMATVTGVVIANPTVVTASASAPAFSCAVDPTKTVVTVVGGGGTGPYTFSKDGVNYFTSNSLPTANNKYAFDLVDNGSIQNPTYWVKDSNGCVQSTTLPAPIDPLPKLVSATASQVTKIDCANGAESIKIDVVGGSIPSDFKYEVSIDGAAFTVLTPSAGASFNYSALAAGSNYQFRITDNVTGCNILSNAYYIPLFNKMKVFASAAANVDCNGNATGAIEINITDYAGPYNYEILKGGVPLVPAITGSGDSSVTSSLVLPSVLKAGTDYTVVVTQGAYPRCTVSSANVIITEPAVLDLSGLKVSVKNQNCNTIGAVLTIDETTIVGGVSGGNTYAFVAAGGTPVYGSSNTITIATTKAAPLFDAYDVYVKDANGCFDHVTVNISQDPMPTVTASVASQCADPAGYTINVVGTGVGTLEYSLDGNSFQTANSFNVNSSGNYTVTVRDANMCKATSTAVTILAPLQLRADIATVPTCLNADGVVTLTASGGSIPANYQYSKDDVTYGSSNIFNGLAPASYTFYVKDMVTNCTKSVAVLIETPNTTIDFSSNKTDVSCKGGSDGSISISLASSTLTVNNNPPYKFSLAGTTVNSVAVSRPLQDSNVFDNLQAGNYVVTIISSKGCQATTSSIEVKEPFIITVPNPAVAPFGCTSGNAMNFATITVNGVTGGTGPYSIYEFFKNGISVQRGASNVYTGADLAGGNYTVTVYDSKGCQGSTAAPIVIAPFISLDKVNVTVNRAITCNNSEEITVSATTTGGTPAVLNYTVAGTGGNVYNQTKTTGIFTGLTVGDYVITVANPTTGCSITSVHYVNAPNTFELKAVKTSDVKCYGSNEGAVQLTVVDTQLVPTNDAGAFTYTLTRPNGTTTNGNSATAGPLTLSGLTAGAYKVTATLTNSPFCSVTTNFTIDQPSAALTVTETHTAITCIAGNNDGTISAVATGGWSGGYEFQLELASGTVIRAWATSPDFTGLVAGNYIVKVRDTKLCVSQVSVPLVNPTPITITATPSVTKVSCFGDKSATITAAANGGQGSNYLYTLNYTSLNPVISSGPQSSPVFTGLGAGSYSITVTDGWSCSVTSTVVTINEPTEVQANLVLASSQTCKTQSRLTLSATGGTAPYRYSATSNIATSVAMVGNSITFPVGNGTFHYYVWDANGCASYISNDISNDPLEPLAVGLDVENAVINCRGDLTGVIVAEAKGGLGNYVYTLVNGSGVAIAPAPVQSTPGRFEGLAAGTYKVSVTSGDCNIVSGTVTITEPVTALTATPTVVNVTCNGNNNGEITINASGGTGIIKYAISPNLDQFFVTNKFVNLKPGFYDLIAQDENGCYVYMKNVQIIEPTPVDVKVDTTKPLTQELCAGDKSGAFSVVITGGTAPYSTVLDNPKGTYVLGQVDFPGLSGGTHTVYVKDAQSCTFELVVPLDMPVTLNPTAVVSNDCVNNAAANKVIVTVDPSNNPADVKYSLDNSGVFQISNVFTNIAPGDHFIMVEHKNGCADATAPFKINKVDPLTISLSLGGLNEIVATVTGGSGVYQFTVNGESIGSNNKYIYFKSGDYTVTVTDSYGCTRSETKYFEFIDITIPPIFTPNGDGNNDNWKPTNTENYPDIKFIIYDRYGRQVGVFGAGQSWDGKYNGTELPMGDYWYILKLRHAQDDREFVGHFTLYR